MYISGTFDPRWNNDILNPAFGVVDGERLRGGRARLARHRTPSCSPLGTPVAVRHHGQRPLRRAHLGRCRRRNRLPDRSRVGGGRERSAGRAARQRDLGQHLSPIRASTTRASAPATAAASARRQTRCRSAFSKDGEKYSFARSRRNERSSPVVNWLLLILPGCIWGASFLFIAEGLDAVAPNGVTFTRILIGFATLSLVPAARRPIHAADRWRDRLARRAVARLSAQHVSVRRAARLVGADRHDERRHGALCRGGREPARAAPALAAPSSRVWRSDSRRGDHRAASRGAGRRRRARTGARRSPSSSRRSSRTASPSTWPRRCSSERRAAGDLARAGWWR